MCFPLAPRGQCAVGRKQNKKRASGFVENLASDAPEGAERDGGGFPEGWEEARWHVEIVVQHGVEAASVCETNGVTEVWAARAGPVVASGTHKTRLRPTPTGGKGQVTSSK